MLLRLNEASMTGGDPATAGHLHLAPTYLHFANAEIRQLRKRKERKTLRMSWNFQRVALTFSGLVTAITWLSFMVLSQDGKNIKITKKLFSFKGDKRTTRK